MKFKDKHALETLPKTMAALIAKADALQAKLADPHSIRATVPASRRSPATLAKPSASSPRPKNSGWSSKSCARNSPAVDACGLLELIGDLVDAGLRADVVLAGRARDADRADHLIADLDRQPAGERQHAGILHRRRVTGLVLQRLAKAADGWLIGARGVSLAVGAFRRVQAGAVAAQLTIGKPSRSRTSTEP